MVIERSSEQSTLNRKVRQGMKKRDILKAYLSENLACILASLNLFRIYRCSQIPCFNPAQERAGPGGQALQEGHV